MVIDFDASSITGFAVLFLITAVVIKAAAKKPPAYYVFLFFMFVYIAAVAKLTLFPIYINCSFEPNLRQSVNLIPFKKLDMRDAVMNIALTVPLGLGAPFIIRRARSLKAAGAVGIIFGIGIESLQLAGALISGGFTARYIDINDAVFNLTGTILGYLILKLSAGLYLKLDKSKLNSFWSYIYDVCSGLRQTG